MKYLLHIDTSSDTGILAIGADGILLKHIAHEGLRNHAASINNMINDLLNSAQISFPDLAAIAVCAGPGSYTGLRIGLATAKGLCYALDKPLIADNKLTLLANNAALLHPGYDQYVSLLIAREREYFITINNDKQECMLQPQHVLEQQLGTLIQKNLRTFLITNAEKNLVEELMIAGLQIETTINTPLSSWIDAAYQKFRCNYFANLMETEPFYLKQVYTHK